MARLRAPGSDHARLAHFKAFSYVPDWLLCNAEKSPDPARNNGFPKERRDDGSSRGRATMPMRRGEPRKKRMPQEEEHAHKRTRRPLVRQAAARTRAGRSTGRTRPSFPPVELLGGL